MSSETNLLDSEEQILEAAKALLQDDASEPPDAAAFADLTRQYGRLLRHLRHLIRIGDRM
ncbi:MAG: hypothetical protein IT490_14620, partial [Candidatus Contendobacter sp.]|nr:hypothetical protein [Candidatus Contendobacter sp.]